MKSKEALVFAILFSVIDIFIPVPVLGLVLIYVLVSKPPWFLALVDDVYGRR
jgi:hypothetical protein